MAPLVAAIRCSASIDADASTTKTIRLPTLRSRTFWRRSSRSSFKRSPGRRPRSFCIGAAARSAPSVGLACRLLTALLANPTLPWQIDAPEVEHLGRIGRGLMRARPAAGHSLIAAGRLLPAVRCARALIGTRFGRRFAVRRLRFARLAFGGLRTLLLLACLGRAVLVRVAPDRLPRAVSKRERGGVVDVLAARRRVATIRGQRPGRMVDHDVGTVAEHVGLDADRGDQARLS